MRPEVIIPDNFRKLCEKKKNICEKYVIDKLSNAILEISNSENPESLGVKKKGELKRYYSYDLTREHRILYTVQRTDTTLHVIFERVCDHKNVYGRD